MKIEISSTSAKPSGKKEVKTPESIKFLLDKSKPKLRLIHSQPGRYVLKGTQGVISILRISKQVKYSPNLRSKIFALREMESISSAQDQELVEAFDLALGAGDYDEPIELLEAEALSYEDEYNEGVESSSTSPDRKAKDLVTKANRKLKNGYEITYDGYIDGTYNFELSLNNEYHAHREVSDTKYMSAAVEDLVKYSQGKSRRGNDAFIDSLSASTSAQDRKAKDLVTKANRKLKNGYEIAYDGYVEGKYTFELSLNNEYHAHREVSEPQYLSFAVEDLVKYSQGKSRRGNGLNRDDAFIDSLSAGPGARNKAAGAKMGRKKRAPNMLAPGWHMFILPKAGGKSKRHYIGPRISGRRLVGIANGDEKVETPKGIKGAKGTQGIKGKTDDSAKIKAKVDKLVTGLQKKVDALMVKFEKQKDKTKKKELAAQVRPLKADLRAALVRQKKLK